MATTRGTIIHGSGNDKNYKIEGEDGNKYRFKDDSQSGQFSEGEKVVFDADGDVASNVVSDGVITRG